MEENELKAFLKKQAELEQKIVDMVEENTKQLDNILIRELLRGIGYDSLKHKNMLLSLLALLESKTPLISEAVSNKLIDGIREHIKMEEEAIRTYSELLEKTDNEHVKLIIGYILEDERRHHALLKKIEKTIIEKQTLSEKDLFELVYYYSVSHGTPGG